MRQARQGDFSRARECDNNLIVPLAGFILTYYPLPIFFQLGFSVFKMAQEFYFFILKIITILVDILGGKKQSMNKNNYDFGGNFRKER